jgi:hypothetical protein
MTFNYKYDGNSTHKYLLPPITNEYGGVIWDQGNFRNFINVNEFSVTDNHNDFDNKQEGFTYLYMTNYSGTPSNPSPITGLLYTRKGEVGDWSVLNWNNTMDFIIKPTSNNYGRNDVTFNDRNKIILSTPFLFYFGLRPGKTAIDKLIDSFGPSGAFKNQDNA